jgi:hypothetical protein
VFYKKGLSLGQRCQTFGSLDTVTGVLLMNRLLKFAHAERLIGMLPLCYNQAYAWIMDSAMLLQFL